MNNIEELIIIGSGPAGYTAAIYAGRANMKPLMIAGTMYGGQLMTTTDVENFPGYASGIAGPMLMTDLHQQAERFGTSFLTEDVTSISGDGPFIVKTCDSTFTTKSVIIATGAKAIWLDAIGEEPLKSRGISTCATCDGALFEGKKLIVVGGGDSAMEEAIFLTKFASEVIIIHRRDTFRASKIMINRAKNNKKIKWITNKIVKEWISTDGVASGVILQDVITDEITTMDIGGAFIAIGHKPCTNFIKDFITLDKNGYISLSENTMTSKPGIFACGDVCDTRYKQAITAAGSGCKAAMDCEKWIEQNS